jgi:hypothetical protein
MRGDFEEEIRAPGKFGNRTQTMRLNVARPCAISENFQISPCRRLSVKSAKGWFLYKLGICLRTPLLCRQAPQTVLLAVPGPMQLRCHSIFDQPPKETTTLFNLRRVSLTSTPPRAHTTFHDFQCLNLANVNFGDRSMKDHPSTCANSKFGGKFEDGDSRDLHQFSFGSAGGTAVCPLGLWGT